MRTFFQRRRRGGLRENFRAPADAFSLVEALVTLSLVIIFLLVLLEFTGSVHRIWKSTATDPFADASEAFERVVRQLAQAELDPYSDYADAAGEFRTALSPASFTPDHPARRSDLAFACGAAAGSTGWLAGSGRTTASDCVFFVAPRGVTQLDAHLGLDHLLNALGYFVEFGDDTDMPAFLFPSAHRWRWRLKEIVQPSESLGIYQTQTSTAWIQPLAPVAANAPVLAENIIALVILPERAASDAGDAISPDFYYDSRDASHPLTRHQLPPRVNVVMVAIDEAAAQILAAQNGTQPPALLPPNIFTVSAQLKSDLTQLDAALTARGINHHIFQREILLPAASWSDVPSS